MPIVSALHNQRLATFAHVAQEKATQVENHWKLGVADLTNNFLIERCAERTSQSKDHIQIKQRRNYMTREFFCFDWTLELDPTQPDA